MADKKKSDDSSSGGGGRAVAQRRPGRNRQARRGKEVAKVRTDNRRVKPDKAQPIARAVPRQSRGLKQTRTATAVASADSISALRPVIKVSIARRLQSRQHASPKLSVALDTVSAARAVVIGKIDSRRRAQVSQRASKRLTARSSTTK